MWIIAGHRGSLEPIDGVDPLTLDCSGCNRAVRHQAFRHVQSATAFFVPVANFRARVVYVCDSCGQRIARPQDNRDSWVDQKGTVAGSLMDAFTRGSELIREGITEAMDELDRDGVAPADISEAQVVRDKPKKRDL